MPQDARRTSNLSLYEFQTEGSARLPTCTVASTLQFSYCTVTVGTSRLTLHTIAPLAAWTRMAWATSQTFGNRTCVHRIVDMFCSANTPRIALLELLHHQLIVLVLCLQSCASRTGVMSLFYLPCIASLYVHQAEGCCIAQHSIAQSSKCLCQGNSGGRADAPRSTKSCWWCLRSFFRSSTMSVSPASLTGITWRKVLLMRPSCRSMAALHSHKICCASHQGAKLQ